MREVAERIGYTTTALYYQFPDKVSLMRELCEQDLLVLSQHFNRLRKVADPIERIRMAGRAYLNFALKHPQHYRLMFMTPHPQTAPEDMRIEKGNPSQDAYAFLLRSVSEAMEAGRFREELKDPDLLAQTLWASMHGIVALHLDQCSEKWVKWRSPAATAGIVSGPFLDGLLR